MAVLADANSRRVYLSDTYMDTRGFALLNGDFWLRVRNKDEYAYKEVSAQDNVLDYLEIRGSAKDLPRWMFTRLLFALKIVRCFQGTDDESWVDFVTIEDGSGQKLYDCVATVHGSRLPRADFGPKRCGSAFVAAQVFYTDKLKDQVAVMAPPCDRPDFWPEWQSPLRTLTITAAERAAVLEYAMAVRDEELAASRCSDDDA